MTQNERKVTCDRCGETRTRTSSRHSLPSAWQTVTFHGPKARVLCVRCQEAVVRFIDDKRE